MKRVHCPTCKKPIIYSPDNPWRPFCSERCKLIDLGEWASESYAIPEHHVGTDPEEASEETPTPPYIEQQTHFSRPDEDER